MKIALVAQHSTPVPAADTSTPAAPVGSCLSGPTWPPA